MISTAILSLLVISTSPSRQAVPNDGIDDGSYFRKAATRACETDHLLKIPAGTFEISQEDGRLGGLNITNCSGLSIVGAGRSATRLRWYRDQCLSAMTTIYLTLMAAVPTSNSPCLL